MCPSAGQMTVLQGSGWRTFGIHALVLALVAMLGLPLPAQDLSGLARLDPARSHLGDAGGGIALDLALSQPVPYRVFTLADPPRLVVDFREVDFGHLRPEAILASARVAGLSWGRFRPGWSRLVATMNGTFGLVSSEMATTDKGATLHVRLDPMDAAAFAAQAAPPDGGIWGLPKPAAVGRPHPRQTGEGPLVVVLDPGHGGIDPGAETATQTEAAITLTFARELAEVLRRAGMKVILTREDDVFVPLETRVSVARASGADVFLSIHADSLAEGEAVGATIYKLATTATDEATERMAERHDRADLLAGVDLSGQDDEVASVLMSLARTETQPRTDRLADTLAIAIRARKLKMHRHPVQGADFSVLKAADIPSILLELGFLSSEADRKRLDDPKWRADMADAILSGLTDWAAADAAEARLLRQ